MSAWTQVLRDATLMRMVPALKRSMEGVIFAFKAVFAENRILGAFGVGVLKNRALDGMEVCVYVCAAHVWWGCPI